MKKVFLPLAGIVFLLASACQVQSRGDVPPPPSPDELSGSGYWSYPGGVEVTLSGNVAQVSITVDPAPYAGGGNLWAKGLPYLFLFSQGTKDALDTHQGLGGVRVRIMHPGGEVMAQALLARGTLNDYSWRQALNVAAQARRDATERPGRMRDLVQWGEDHTEFEYNPRYVTSQ